MISICKHSRSMTQDNKPSKRLKKNFIIALSLAILLGLGWGIGLLASTYYEAPELSFIFQVIFAVFVGSQGVIIFILHGVRDTDFRDFWLQLLQCSKCQLHCTVSSPQKNKTSSGSDGRTLSVALSTSQSYHEKQDLDAVAEERSIDGPSIQSPTVDCGAQGVAIIVSYSCPEPPL